MNKSQSGVKKKLEIATLSLARACDGNPVYSTATIILFMVMFNMGEAVIETLLFGDRFEHWLDPIFTAGFMAYAAYAVKWCAIWNSVKHKEQGLGKDRSESTKHI